MRTTRCWAASVRGGRPIVLTALLVLLVAPGGGAAAAPGKDPREKELPGHGRVHLVSPARPSGKTAAVPARPEPAWRTGIVESGQAPFSGALYRFENQWHEIVGGQHVNVYAGALAERPEQGVLVIQTTPLEPGRRAGAPTVVRARGTVGPLRLVSAQGTHLHVAAAGGRYFTFHVLSRDLRPD